eukprot:scaffold201170_cov33-Tisochrysis_lutea.AAC.3
MGEQGFAKRLLQFRCCARGRGYGGDGHNSVDQVRLFVPEVWTNGTLPGVSLEAAPTWIVDHNAASLSGETDHQLGLHVKSVAPNTLATGVFDALDDAHPELVYAYAKYLWATLAQSAAVTLLKQLLARDLNKRNASQRVDVCGSSPSGSTRSTSKQASTSGASFAVSPAGVAGPSSATLAHSTPSWALGIADGRESSDSADAELLDEFSELGRPR